MRYNRKPIPNSVLIFGAAGRLGGPLAEFLTRDAPSTHLRLIGSKPDSIEKIKAKFPNAEVVQANYFDLDSLRAAVKGMEGVFVVTTTFLMEQAAMTNLVTALKEDGSLIHMLRVLGLQPEMNVRHVTQPLIDHGFGLPIQHPIAKKVLDESGLPVTYMNIGATMMDGMLLFSQGLQRERKVIWPEHLIPYIHPTDIAETACRLLLSDNHRHIGQFHTLNNGHDLMRFRDLAQLMSEVWNEKITFDGRQEVFFEAYPMIPRPIIEQLWHFFMYEQDNEVVWALNDFVERTIGRKPMQVRDYLIQNRAVLLGA